MQKYVSANICCDKLCSMISTKTGRQVKHLGYFQATNIYLPMLCTWSKTQTHKVWTADQCVALVLNGDSSNYWMLPT